MPTYAQYGAIRETRERRMAQDRVMAERHAGFDADVAQNTDKRGGWKRMKWERPQFAVVTASDAFREGWDRIFRKEPA